MTYSDYIQHIIDTRGQWAEEVRNSPRGCECHHIIPKCKGGLPTNNGNLPTLRHPNIIWLYPAEHFTAHKLLALENPTDLGILIGWNRMCRIENQDITAEEYEQLKWAFRTQIGHPVKCLETGEVFSTVAAASAWAHTSSGEISGCLTGRRHSVGGYHWGPVDITEAEAQSALRYQPQRNNQHAIYCLELKQSFNSISEASRVTGVCASSIRNALKGRYNTAGGYHWCELDTPIEAQQQILQLRPNLRPVHCIETGQSFPTIKAAAEWAGVASCSLHDGLNGRSKTVAGYHWQYVVE